MTDLKNSDWGPAGIVVDSEMMNRVDARRRWFGAFFLVVAVGMLVWGETFLQGTLMRHPFAFLFYWLGCFGLTGLALLTALLDAYILRRRTREQQAKVFRQSFLKEEGEPWPVPAKGREEDSRQVLD